MNHDHTTHNKTNRTHEWLFRVIFEYKKSIFHELLAEDKSIRVQARNLLALAMEKYFPQPNLIISLEPIKVLFSIA